MPVLASDAISSVAYASEEILWVLIPAIGLASYLWMPKVAISIILLLVLLTISYRQIVDAYPDGGGAYLVAKENLGNHYGLIVGASLSVDYTLTVAVSISAATAAITSALPYLFPHRVAITLIILTLIVIGNMRGVKESTRAFSLPTYAFIIILLMLIVVGVLKYPGYVPIPAQTVPGVDLGTQLVSVFLLMRAFSSGCAAVTGVEAICDAVPNFKAPAPRNAKIAYVLLALFVMFTFGGITYLAQLYQAVPNPHQTVIAQLGLQIFGKGTIFYLIQATTAIILAMAANTAFAGFPTLLSIIAQDGYAPRQFSLRGHRLNFSNGIVLLALAAATLVIIFKGNTHLLIPLYALGVFTSFTLAQAGTFMLWLKTKPTGWQHKAIINGLGTLITFITVIIVGVTKFKSGAWIVLVIVPLLVFIMTKIKLHYISIAHQLDVKIENFGKLKLSAKSKPYVIIPISSLNTMVIKAIRYAKSISPNIVAFNVETQEGGADKLRCKWEKLNPGVPLVIKQSPYREVVGPLLTYLRSEEHESKPGDMITVLLPQFTVQKWWEVALHNNTSLVIASRLFKDPDIVVSIMPFYIKDLPELKN